MTFGDPIERGALFDEVPEIYDRVRPSYPAELGCTVTAVEPGAESAELARQRLVHFPNVAIETSTFEAWNSRDRRFDILVAASPGHWIDPTIGWRRARDALHPGGWIRTDLGDQLTRRYLGVLRIDQRRD